jgi:hypothetical protein
MTKLKSGKPETRIGFILSRRKAGDISFYGPFSGAQPIAPPPVPKEGAVGLLGCALAGSALAID